MRAATIFLIALLTSAAACSRSSTTSAFALRGTILTPDDIIEDGVVVIREGRIHSILRSSSAPEDLSVVDTDGIILPGLIDLHNHILWSVFPRWNPHGAFANRDTWRESSVFVEHYSKPQSALRRRFACDMNRFGEVRAIAGGVSSIVGSLRAQCAEGLVRNLDSDRAFASGDGATSTTLLDVDLLSPGNMDALATRLRQEHGARLFVHVAEGRADDAETKEEFARLVANGLLTERTVIVHGNGLGDAEFEAIAAAGASIVWSPRSNMELYGETTAIAMTLDRNIPMALAPDWSLTGSANLLEEMRYAADWSRANVGELLTDRQLVEMATAVPAAIAGIADKVGSIQIGMHADLLVIRGSRKNPYRAVVHARPSDVRLVTVNGVPAYGTPGLMRQLHNGWDFEVLDICGTRMAVDTTPGAPSLLDRRYRFAATAARLSTALSSLQRSFDLPPVVACALDVTSVASTRRSSLF